MVGPQASQMIDRRWLMLGAAAYTLLPGGLAFAKPPQVRPERQGFSTGKLGAMDAELQALVASEKLAGITSLIARRGEIVYLKAHGYADVAAKTPLKEDSIFRIASMTKPVVGVAMMILHDEGKWRLDDRVDQHIPEFRGLKVKAIDGFIDEQVRPMTMRQLMSHSAGFDSALNYAGGSQGRDGLQGLIDALAAQPLAFQPGTDWRYGPGASIQGYIVEKMSGMNLDQFFRKRIFEPLRMGDTGYYLPVSEVGRIVRMNTYGPDGKVTPAPFPGDPTQVPSQFSGSSGLFSTAEDYWRFAQMIANSGEFDGVRIMTPESARLLRQNALPSDVKVDIYGPSQEGVGFGLNFAVLVDPVAARSPMGLHSHWWGGGYGTWFWIDPTNDIVCVMLIQNLRGTMPDAGTPPMREIFPRLVYAVLENPRP